MFPHSQSRVHFSGERSLSEPNLGGRSQNRENEAGYPALVVQYVNRARDVLAYIGGRYRRFRLLPLEGAESMLETSPRGAVTEISLPELGRAATVVFSEAI